MKTMVFPLPRYRLIVSIISHVLATISVSSSVDMMMSPPCLNTGGVFHTEILKDLYIREYSEAVCLFETLGSQLL